MSSLVDGFSSGLVATTATGAGSSRRGRRHAIAAACVLVHSIAAACVLVLAFACTRAAPVVVRTWDGGRMGTVHLFSPAGSATTFVFLFSDTGGWSALFDQAARRAAADGAVVVGVDLPTYLARLARSDDQCHYVVSELEYTSKKVQRALEIQRYLTPVVSGVGAGGTLAYAALAQAPAATLAGAVSVDPSPALGTKVPLCAGAPFTASPGGGFRYGSQPTPRGWWKVVATGPLPAEVAAATGGTPGAAVTHASGPWESALDGALSAVAASPRPTGAEEVVADLPLVELPAQPPGQPGSAFAVVFSGDGGWRDLDKRIAETLSARGVPVVGVDSLRYFWEERTPQEVADHLASILEAYSKRWHRPQAILIGYSFGADILPFAVNRLPAAERRRVELVALLGPSSLAPFEIEIGALLGVDPTPDGLPVLPELRRLDLTRVQCFYGADERDSLCPSPELAGAERIRTQGGHHFGGDYETIADRILQRAARMAPPGKSPAMDAGHRSERAEPVSRTVARCPGALLGGSGSPMVAR